MKKLALLFIFAVVACATPARAIDYWGGPPGWDRGEPGSTYQKFDMSTPIAGLNPANVNENPFGIPYIEMEGNWEWAIVDGPTPGETVDAWHSEGDGMGGGSSVLRLIIPNAPEPNPIKKIFVQITSTKAPSSVTPVGQGTTGPYTAGTFPTGLPQIQHPGSYQGLPWYTYNYGLTIEPNPEFEELLIEIPYCGWIDQIDVDTICTIPESTPLAILLAGGAVVLWQSRRQ